MFFITNLPRVLLNFYELYNVNEMIACEDQFIPPTWFICSTSANHLLLILNCLMNFTVYCFLNKNFCKILLGKTIGSNNNHHQTENRLPERSFHKILNQAVNGEANCNVAVEPKGTPGPPTQSPEENKETEKTERATSVGRK